MFQFHKIFLSDPPKTKSYTVYYGNGWLSHQIVSTWYPKQPRATISIFHSRQLVQYQIYWDSTNITFKYANYITRTIHQQLYIYIYMYVYICICIYISHPGKCHIYPGLRIKYNEDAKQQGTIYTVLMCASIPEPFYQHGITAIMTLISNCIVILCGI